MLASTEVVAVVSRSCRNEKSSTQAVYLFDYVRRSGLDTHSRLGNYLVALFVAVGCLCYAQKAFDKLIHRNASSWSSLITGYVNCGMPQLALDLYRDSQERTEIYKHALIFPALLKACTELKDLRRGKEIHNVIASCAPLKEDVFICSSLISMYAQCGCIEKAEEVFQSISPVKDTVIWNSLITAYTNCGRDANALDCFELMQPKGISPNVVTYICGLRTCGNLCAIKKGREIHAEVHRKGLLEKEIVLSNALVDMYAKCGLFNTAHDLFEGLPIKNVTSWTALIAGYTKHERGEEALNCFKHMQLEGIPPNTVTFACCLKACGKLGATDEGQQIHYEIVRKGLERDPLVGCSLLDMYVKCGLLAKAQEVFDHFLVRDVILWTTLISGYVNYGCNDDALTCLDLMQLENLSPNDATYLSCLKACGNIGAINKGQEIHEEIARKGLLEVDHLAGNALIDMYAKCFLLYKAQEVFDGLLVRDIISWTTMIAGYTKEDRAEEALHCFEEMQWEGFSPNVVTLVCTVKACGSIQAATKGLHLHTEISNKGLETNLIVGSTLVDMYAKCGLLLMAQKVFDKLPSQDVILWNSLISGYAHLGQHNTVFRLFDRMTGEGKLPDGITFTNLLNACSQAGLVNEGLTYFETISQEYGIIPTIEHHGCIIDLLGRVGEISKATVMMERIPAKPNLVLLRTILGACQKWGSAELGRKAFDQVVRLNDPS